MDNIEQTAQKIYEFVITEGKDMDAEPYYSSLSEIMDTYYKNVKLYGTVTREVPYFRPYVVSPYLAFKPFEQFYSLMSYAENAISDTSLCFENSLCVMYRLIVEQTQQYINEYRLATKTFISFNDDGTFEEREALFLDPERAKEGVSFLNSDIQNNYLKANAPKHRSTVIRIHDYYYKSILIDLCSAFETSLYRIVSGYNWKMHFSENYYKNKKSCKAQNLIEYLSDQKTLGLKLSMKYYFIGALFMVRNSFIHGNPHQRGVEQIAKYAPEFIQNKEIQLSYEAIMKSFEVCGKILTVIEKCFLDQSELKLSDDAFDNRLKEIDWKLWYKYREDDEYYKLYCYPIQP